MSSKYEIEFSCTINIDDISTDKIEDNPEDVISSILCDAGYPESYVDILNVKYIGD
jgi:hypothetical protein